MSNKRNDYAVIRNGFYTPEAKKCDRQIGQQKLTADRLYIYRYNRETGEHEGQ